MAKYKDAIKWIVLNDDITFLDTWDEHPFESVSAALIADLFNKSTEQVVNDMLKEKRRQYKEAIRHRDTNFKRIESLGIVESNGNYSVKIPNEKCV